MGPSGGEYINLMWMFWSFFFFKGARKNSKCTQKHVLISKQSVEQEIFGTEYDL